MKGDQIAAEMVQRGQMREAQKRLRLLLAEHETSLGWNDLGAVQFQLNDWREAETSFRRAIVLDQAHAVAQVNLGLLLAQRGRGVEAIGWLERAIALLDDEPSRETVRGALEIIRTAVAAAGDNAGTAANGAEASGPQTTLAGPERTGLSADVAQIVDRFLENATRGDSRGDAVWAYLNQRLESYLRALPDNFAPGSPCLRVARSWAQASSNLMTAGDSAAQDWRRDHARMAMARANGEKSAGATVAEDACEPILHAEPELEAALLNEFRFAFRGESESISTASSGLEYSAWNGIYDGGDGDSLYCMLRYLKPPRILHFGSANSILLAGAAIARNRQLDPRSACELLAVDPFPNSALEFGSPEVAAVLRGSLRDFLDSPEWLVEGSVLFIDSSIALRDPDGADYLFTRVLPHLSAATWVHLHDVSPRAESYFPGVARQNQRLRELVDRGEFDVALVMEPLQASGAALARQAFPHFGLEAFGPASALWMRKR